MEQLNLSAEQRNAVTDELKKIDVQIAEIQTALPAAIQKQADLIKVEKPNDKAVMKAVDNVWGLRGKMAKLQTQKILVIKKHLTVEQQKRALELMQESRAARRPPQTQQPPPSAPQD